MARTIDQIKAQIDAEIANRVSISTLLSNPSKVSNWRDWRHGFAVCVGLFEQLLDKFLSDSETIIASGPVGSRAWLKQKIFEFQYDSVTPQIIQLDSNFVPSYPVVDETKRIITICRLQVTNPVSNELNVLVAKSDPPVKLTSGEKTALSGYLNDEGDDSALATGIGFAGGIYTVVSEDPDQVYFNGTIYHDGQYTSTIAASVRTALETYLKTLDNEGMLRVNSWIEAIKSVPSVKDVFVGELWLRKYNVVVASATKLVNSGDVVYLNRSTFAGYAIPETTIGDTLEDLVTYEIV